MKMEDNQPLALKVTDETLGPSEEAKDPSLRGPTPVVGEHKEFDEFFRSKLKESKRGNILGRGLVKIVKKAECYTTIATRAAMAAWRNLFKPACYHLNCHCLR